METNYLQTTQEPISGVPKIVSGAEACSQSEAMQAFEKWFKENPDGGIFIYGNQKFRITKKSNVAWKDADLENDT